MMLKTFGLAGVMAALATTCAAAQAPAPLLGTWVLDVKASTYPADAPKSVLPKTHSETYRLLPSGEVELVTSTVYQDGASFSGHTLFPAEGGRAHIVEPANPRRTAVQTQLGPNEWLTTQMMDGKQSVTIHKVISADGRTRRDAVRGRAQDGHLYEDIEVFARQ